MMNRKQIVNQFEYLENLLLTESKKMNDEALKFNLGMLAAYGLVLNSRQCPYERRYAEIADIVRNH